MSESCWLCGGEGTAVLTAGPLRSFRCHGCGEYQLTSGVQNILADDHLGFKIACFLRERRGRGDSQAYRVILDKDTDSEAATSEHNTVVERNDIVSSFPKPTEIVDRALVNLSRRVQHPMDMLEISRGDLQFLMFCPEANLDNQISFMKTMDVLAPGLYGVKPEICISPTGWQRIAEFAKSGRESRQAFVAMWFDKSMVEVEGAICKGVKDAGYKAQIIKNKIHNNDINHEIIAEIRKSRFVVADFTAGRCSRCDNCRSKKGCKNKVRARGGVYFEAGYAKGLGLEVIWMVREDQKDQMHFDTSHFNHIIYQTPTDLARKLKVWIESTIR